MAEKIDETDNALEFLMQDLEMELTDEHVSAFQIIMDDLKKLRMIATRFSCLEMAGVDNWSGYGHSFELMEEYYPELYKEFMG